MIDLEEQRGFFSGETFRGKFPIVSLLKGKGSSAAAGLIEALPEEQDERRFAMICDVLRTVYGAEKAEKALERASRQVGATAEKKAAWERASSLLKSSPLEVF